MLTILIEAWRSAWRWSCRRVTKRSQTNDRSGRGRSFFSHRRRVGPGRERHGERRAATGTALDGDRPSVRFRDPLADGEPESGAGTLPGPAPGGVGPPETVEDV